MISEQKLREIGDLADQSNRTAETRIRKPDYSRHGEEEVKSDGFVTGDAITEVILDEMKIPSLPETKLYRLLQSLTREEMCQLQAIMWLGRDSFVGGDCSDEQEEFSSLYQHAKKSYDEYCVEYVIAKSPVLKEHITRGMVLLSMAEKEST